MANESTKSDGHFFPEIAESVVEKARAAALRGEQVNAFDQLKAAVPEISLTNRDAVNRYAKTELPTAYSGAMTDAAGEKDSHEAAEKVAEVVFKGPRTRIGKFFARVREVITGHSRLEEKFEHQAEAVLEDTQKRFDKAGLSHEALCTAPNLTQASFFQDHKLATTAYEQDGLRPAFMGNSAFNTNPLTVVKDSWGRLIQPPIRYPGFDKVEPAEKIENSDIAHISNLAAEAYTLQECTKGARPVEAVPNGAPLPNRAVQKPHTNAKQ